MYHALAVFHAQCAHFSCTLSLVLTKRACSSLTHVCGQFFVSEHCKQSTTTLLRICTVKEIESIASLCKQSCFVKLSILSFWLFSENLHMSCLYAAMSLSCSTNYTDIQPRRDAIERFREKSSDRQIFRKGNK